MSCNLNFRRTVKVATDLNPNTFESDMAVHIDIKLSVTALQDYAVENGEDAAWDVLAAAIQSQLKDELKKAWAARSQP